MFRAFLVILNDKLDLTRKLIVFIRNGQWLFKMYMVNKWGKNMLE